MLKIIKLIAIIFCVSILDSILQVCLNYASSPISQYGKRPFILFCADYGYWGIASAIFIISATTFIYLCVYVVIKNPQKLFWHKKIGGGISGLIIYFFIGYASGMGWDTSEFGILII